MTFEGHSDLALNGVFDQKTFDAVSAFQVKYFDDILKPWGHTLPTGYVYILTLKKVNEIYCQRLLPVSEAQTQEIVAFKALLDGLRAQGINPELPGALKGNSTSSPVLPVVGTNDKGGILKNGQSIRNIASAIFATPDNLKDMAKSLYGLAVILVALYVLGNVLKDVLYKNSTGRRKFLVKWFTINIGLALAVIVAYVLEWLFILPLLVALVLTLVWTSLHPEHNSIRASVKSWYLVSLAWVKSNFKGKSELTLEPIKKDDIEKVIVMGPKK